MKSKPSLAFFNACNQGSGAENLVSATVSALVKRGHEASLHVRTIRQVAAKDAPSWVTQLPFPASDRVVERLLRQATGYNDYFFRTGRHFLSQAATRGAQIWHLHNLHGHYLSIPALSRLSLVKPIVLSPVDEFLATGYCTYRLGCGRLSLGCGECPQIDTSYPKISRDATAALFKIKHKAVLNSKFHILVHTRYLENFYRENFGDGARISRLYYGVDVDIFKPVDRAIAASRLGLQHSRRFVVGLMHSQIMEPRKGLVGLLERLRAAAASAPGGIELLVVGGGSEAAKAFATEGLTVTTIPYLAGEAPLADAFNLCDVLLYPTKGDNLSLTTLCALSCGVPVISSAIGGQGEAISDGVEGFLCTTGHLDEFIERLMLLKGDDELLKTMKAAARARALKQFDFASYITNLQLFYDRVLAETNHHE